MTMIYPGAMVVIVIFLLAFNGGEGFWSNLIMFVNVFFAGLVATNYFEPLASWLTNQWISLAMFSDYISFWLLFILFYGLMAGMTATASTVKVKTISAVDKGLGYLFSVATGWLLICMVSASMHFAPLGRDIMFGGFRPEDPSFLGMSPDRAWFAFNQKLSLGAFSRSPDPDNPNRYVFDGDGSIMLRYASRREIYEDTSNLSGSEGLRSIPTGVDPTL